MDELWDVARVAEHLGVTERTVYNKVRSGDLPAVRVGRLWRVNKADLDAWLSQSDSRSAGQPRRRMPAPRAPQGHGEAFEPGPYPCADNVERAGVVAEANAIPSRTDLEALLQGEQETLGRRLMFVGLLTKAVEALGWPAPVVVGGHAVEFYTAGDYPTLDIDLAGASEPVAAVLTEWQFTREGRHYFDERLNLVIEVPGGSLLPDELEHCVGVRVAGVTAYVIGVEDLIIDRLSACVFRDHADSCEWARTLLASALDLDHEYLYQRAETQDVIGRLRQMEAEL